MCVCVCVYALSLKHTHTHIYIYVYIYILIFVVILTTCFSYTKSKSFVFQYGRTDGRTDGRKEGRKEEREEGKMERWKNLRMEDSKNGRKATRKGLCARLILCSEMTSFFHCIVCFFFCCVLKVPVWKMPRKVPVRSFSWAVKRLKRSLHQRLARFLLLGLLFLAGCVLTALSYCTFLLHWYFLTAHVLTALLFLRSLALGNV